MTRFAAHTYFNIKSFSEIINFKYPTLSWGFYIAASLFALIFDMNYLPMYFIIASICVILANNEEF